MTALLLMAVLGQYVPTPPPYRDIGIADANTIVINPGTALMESCAGHDRGWIYCTHEAPPSDPWWKPILVGLHVLFAFAVAMLGAAGFARFLRIVGAVWDVMK